MLKPCAQLKKTIEIINYVFNEVRAEYWIAFGGLIGIVKKNGIIPDGDIDICTYYSNSHLWEKIIQKFEIKGYKNSKVLLNDADTSKAMYMGFNYAKDNPENPKGCFFPHICLSFWYPDNGISYWCHDEKKELHGAGIPPSGYYLKGLPTDFTKYIKRIEWPGISNQLSSERIKAPLFPGIMLDWMYPGWAYNKQKYMGKPGEIIEEKMEDFCKSSAVSKYQIHLKSMNEFNNTELIKNKLNESVSKYDKKINDIIKLNH